MVSSSRRQESGPGLDPAGADPGYVYPKDEFDVDDWAGPVGAHRAARKGWLVALPWLVGAAVILLLTGVALSLGLGRNKGDDTTVAAPTKSVTAQASSSGTPAAATPTSAQTRAAGTATTGAPTVTTSAATPTSATAGSSDSPSTEAAAGTVNKQTRIQILNSTRRNGVAHRLQDSMRADGWNVASVDTYRKRRLPSVVYYRDPADRSTAQAVAALYGVGVRQSSAWSVPVTLMIGPDFRS